MTAQGSPLTRLRRALAGETVVGVEVARPTKEGRRVDVRLSVAPVRDPDGELLVKIEEDVRGRDCFIVQPTSHPVNAHLMEVMVWIDCLRRASANSSSAAGHVMLIFNMKRSFCAVVPARTWPNTRLAPAAGIGIRAP